MDEMTHRTGTYSGETTELLIWEITDEQGVAAELYVHPAAGMIMNIEVRPDRQGEGLARALYEAASRTRTVYHVPAWGRSDEGNAFADAIGGPVLDDETAAELVDFDLTILAA